MNMVHRMIGTRIGTGGSSGKEYLKSAADKHYIFKEIAQLNSFFNRAKKIAKIAGRVGKEIRVFSRHRIIAMPTPGMTPAYSLCR